MKKQLLTNCLLFIALTGCTQNPRFQELLTKGKEEYKLQIAKDTPSFTKATHFFKEAVQLEPTNAEARYFYAYSLDKLNGSHAGFMDNTKLELTIQASEQMEKVIEFQPIYKGEKLLLDPYSKLTSIWGSLAFSYLSNQKSDSAIWALTEGKKRGGYINALLEYNKQLLNQCKPNAVLITSGDNITFPMLYLQQINGYRKDVTVVDAAMINAAWYFRILKRNDKISISLIDKDLNILGYERWNPTQINILSKADPTQALAWTLYPTYYQNYILNGDKVLLDIFKQNYFEKEFYYTIPVDTTMNLFLTDYLKDEGLLLHVVSTEDNEVQEETLKKNLRQFSIERLTDVEIKKSPDVLGAFNNMRWAYLKRAYQLSQFGLEEEAKELFQDMEKKFPLEKLPVYPDHFESNYQQIKRFIFK